MEQATEELERIREMGYRVTPQRQLILEAVRESGGHITAVEVYERLQAQVPALNQATVYRTLDFLCELRLIAKTEIHGQTVYEIVEEERHHHLVCRHCGQVEHLADHHLTDLSQHLMEEHGFKAEIDHLAISGICAHCQGE
jgi:Fur family ferric uptake transcriptional regulator